MTASKNKNLVNYIPMILVVAMVVLLLSPAVATVIRNAARNRNSGTTDTEATTETVGDGDYYLTWEEYIAGHGITDWNWNDAADAIERVAFHAADLYEAGDMDQAYDFAKATYWGYYETTGFERNVMTYISGSRVSAVELQFTTLRKAVKKDLGLETVKEEAQKLSDMLHEDALVLSPEGAIASVGGGQAEDYYLTWEEYIAGHGITNWNWNDAADAIEKVAFHAADLYEAGDMDQAYDFAKATYWGYYETTGFERNVMTYISGSRVSAVELQFTTLRKAVKKDLGLDTVKEEAQKLSDMLHEDALVLSPEGAIAESGAAAEAGDAAETKAADTTTISSGSAAATFVGSFGIILREGLEAILVVGAIIAYLIKSGNKKGIIPVYVGSVLGIVCSFIMAGILAWLKSINPETTMTQEIIEGFAALIAVVVLFYVSNWMVSKSEAAAWEGYIQGKVEGSVQTGNMFALGFTAWLAVFREGAEVILFYQPMLGEGHANMVWAGFGVGCAVLVVVFLLIRFLSIRLPIKPFFLATSILMAFMTICFLGSGIKELMEGGVFDDFEFMLTKPSWLLWIPDAASGTGGTAAEVCNTLGFYPYLGTFIPQVILLVITVVTFVIVLKRNKRIRLEAEAQKQAQA
ncbi:MAG: FTR1 family iron permease [Blautia sp.]|nr:FTR1 family iron permease [Blautia sp.]